MRYDHHSMLPILAFRTFGGKIISYEGGGKGGSKAPDYTPIAQASKEAAQIMAAQADRVLDEGRRQYDLNMEVAKPIIDAQAEISAETARQGKDYYDYMVSQQRPVEEALNREAMEAGSDGAQQAAADKAIADSQGGYTRVMNQVLRQSRRYGMAPIAATGTMAVQQAANTAAAAGAAREKEKNLGYAKKLDVAGLYRGLPGASQGAYSTAINSGNSAVGNQMAPSGQLMNGSIAAAGITGQGQQMRMQGLGNILSSQTQMAMNDRGDDGLFSALGTLGGAAITKGSDRRMKENINLVGKDDRTGLNLYEFNYIGDPRRYRGVMADEVEPVMPRAVVRDDLGFASVDYAMLGIEFSEVTNHE